MNYAAYFNKYCREYDLDIMLSSIMPVGYENANGTFDPVSRTVYINVSMLDVHPDYEKLFYLFHELRHASQYLHPTQFDELIIKSQRYAIMYDGVCYKLVDGEWKTCRLDGSEDFFTEMYLGQPYEMDANTFAYEQVKSLLGDSHELQALYSFWMPKASISDDVFRDIYCKIDRAIEHQYRIVQILYFLFGYLMLRIKLL